MTKYAIVEINDQGETKIITESYSLLDLSKAPMEGSFPSVFVSREDLYGVFENRYDGNNSPAFEDELKAAKEKIDAISDDDMIHLASKMQDFFVDDSYWLWLSEYLEEHNITVDESLNVG